MPAADGRGETAAQDAGKPAADAAPPDAPDANDVASAELRREMRQFVRSHELRRKQLPRAILVGLLVGLVAVGFRLSLLYAQELRLLLVEMAWEHPLWAPLLPIFLGAGGAAIAVQLVRSFAPEASGSGIPHVKAVLYGSRPMRRRVLPVKFLGGVAGIGGGLVMGREGPTIQMGAAVGHFVSGWLRVTQRESRTLIASGAGAGLAAAFNAPLAGLVFVLEEVQRDFSPTVFTAALVASAVADVVTRILLGQLPVFHVASEAIPPLEAVPAALVVGVLAAFAGVAFNRALVASLDYYAGLRWKPWLVGAAVGAGVGAIGLFLPEVLGGGDRLVEKILAGNVSFAALVGLFLLRFALTMASYGTGAPGGIFAPLLMLGSALGLAAGQLASMAFPATFEHPEAFAAVGMAAYFSAIVRAPLTGVVLMVEMTGNYGLVLPLMAASLSAYGIADYLKDRPVYEALLERDLRRGQEAPPALDGPLLLELAISARSRFDGATIEELALPTGCLAILLRRGLLEEVPLPTTRLSAGDQLTIVVAPHAAAAVPRLRAGADSH